MQDLAKPAVPAMLKAVVDTAEPVSPVVWEDPIQLTHGELAAALFNGLLNDSIAGLDTKLLYPAIQAIVKNPDGMARATLSGIIENNLSEEDVKQLAPDILEAIKIPCPADTMFSGEIRMSAFLALTKYQYQEGIEAGVIFAQTQGGHGSETRTGQIMEIIAGYGSAAKGVIPELHKLIDILDRQAKNNEFPSDLNQQRTSAVKKAIHSIESATTHPEMKTIVTSSK